LRAVFYDYQNTEKEEERSFHGKIPLPFLWVFLSRFLSRNSSLLTTQAPNEKRQYRI
jgi:hypothetical protein